MTIIPIHTEKSEPVSTEISQERSLLDLPMNQNISPAVTFVMEAAKKRRFIATQQAQDLQKSMGLTTKKHLVLIKS